MDSMALWGLAGLPLADRMLISVGRSEPNECWPWKGRVSSTGYGTIKHRGRTLKAHRVAYEMANGPIPDGLVVMHICDNPPCCNPNHLRLGTVADNNNDRDQKGRNAHSAKTHCLWGHEFNQENTYVTRHGHRVCRACRRKGQSGRLSTRQ
jgi:hypothetical protein